MFRQFCSHHLRHWFAVHSAHQVALVSRCDKCSVLSGSGHEAVPDNLSLFLQVDPVAFSLRHPSDEALNTSREFLGQLIPWNVGRWVRDKVALDRLFICKPLALLCLRVFQLWIYIEQRLPKPTMVVLCALGRIR